MAVRRLAPDDVQPPTFAFSEETEAFAREQIAKYPEGRQMSAVVPLLWKVQGQCGGWLPQKALEAVAERLGMAYIRVLEVATFYTMFNLEPVGRHFIQCCGTTPCALRGANDLMAGLKRRIGEQRHVTPDGNFSWLEVECLGACCNAPMVQINDTYYEDLTPEILDRILDDLAAGRSVKPGPQQGRNASEPAGELTTLQEPTLFDGSQIGAWRKRFEETSPAAEARAENEARTTEQRVATDTRPAKPDAGRAIESPAADTPAARASAGETPVRPNEPEGVADPSRKTVSKGSVPGDQQPAPKSDLSYVSTPVKPEEGRTVAHAPAEGQEGRGVDQTGKNNSGGKDA